MASHLDFYGGVHPAEDKLAKGNSIQIAPLRETYLVPLQMHIGAPAKLLVAKGDKVLRGQMIGEASGFVSAPVHSPTSGVIKDVTTALNPTGARVPAVLLESDGEDKAGEMLEPIEDWQNTETEILRKRVGEAGVVGMGGASFPALVKLSPSKPVDTLIINGVECEPCLTADHRLMLEHTERVITGCLIVGRLLNVKEIKFGIELNKPDALAKLQEVAKGTKVQICPLHVRYPQGAEKQLIYALTGRKVPSGGLPMDVGCVVQNVASVAVTAEAICDGKPLYERIVTVTGRPVVNPGNWLVRVGTRLADLIRLAGGVKEDPAKIISGGPMMGFSVYSLDIPVMKNTSGLVLLSRSEIVQYQSKSCLHCGRCNDACPMQLMPSLLSQIIESGKFDMAEQWHVMDCIECGCCSYICPAQRPLVQHMRRGKMEVAALRKARKG